MHYMCRHYMHYIYIIHIYITRFLTKSLPSSSSKLPSNGVKKIPTVQELFFATNFQQDTYHFIFICFCDTIYQLKLSFCLSHIFPSYSSLTSSGLALALSSSFSKISSETVLSCVAYTNLLAWC